MEWAGGLTGPAGVLYLSTLYASPESFLQLPTAVFHILIALAGRDRHGCSIMQDVAARADGTA